MARYDDGFDRLGPDLHGYGRHGTRQSLLRTEDGGRHWVDVTPPGAGTTPWPSLYGDTVPLAAIDGDRAWLLDPRDDGTVFVWRTADGGRTWQRVFSFAAGDVLAPGRVAFQKRAT